MPDSLTVLRISTVLTLNKHKLTDILFMTLCTLIRQAETNNRHLKTLAKMATWVN